MTYNFFQVAILTLLLAQGASAEESKNQADSTAVDNQEIMVEVKSDASYVTTEKTYFNVLTEQGRKDLATQKVVYDPAVVGVEIIEAGVQDGVVHREVPLDLVKKSERLSGKADEPPLIQLEIPFGELQVGAVTWLKVKRTPCKRETSGIFNMDFVYGFLKFEKKGEIQIVSERPLYFQVNDPEHILQIESKNLLERFEIRIRLMKPVLSVGAETLRVATQEELRAETPRVQVSSVESWNEFAQRNLKFYQSRLEPPLPKDLQKVAKELGALN